MRRLSSTFAAAAAIMTLTACSEAPPPDTRAADAKAIQDAEINVNTEIAKKDRDVDKIASFWGNNGSLFIPGMPIVTGNAAIKSFLKEAGNDPNFTLVFKSNKVEVSKASDYGYTTGTYVQTMTDPKTKKVLTERGKYVTVFQKQADGAWKAVEDINNADAPATPESAKK